MYRSGRAQRVSGSGVLLLTGKGSWTELCVEDGGGGSVCLDGLHRTIRISDETGNPQRAGDNAIIPQVAILASDWVAWRRRCLGRQWSWHWSKAWCEVNVERELSYGNYTDQHSCKTNAWNLRPLLSSWTQCRNWARTSWKHFAVWIISNLSLERSGQRGGK